MLSLDETKRAKLVTPSLKEATIFIFLLPTRFFSIYLTSSCYCTAKDVWPLEETSNSCGCVGRFQNQTRTLERHGSLSLGQYPAISAEHIFSGLSRYWPFYAWTIGNQYIVMHRFAPFCVGLFLVVSLWSLRGSDLYHIILGVNHTTSGLMIFMKTWI